MTTTNLAVTAARRSTVTLSDIRALGYEAGCAGDTAEVAICERALNGSARARAYCVRRIRATRVEAAASAN